MMLSELKIIVDRCLVMSSFRQDGEVMISIKLPYSTIGSSPMVAVKHANYGFDWDAGKFIITPEESLTPTDRDFEVKMRDMQDKLGWAEYENRNLKAEIKKLKEALK